MCDMTAPLVRFRRADHGHRLLDRAETPARWPELRSARMLEDSDVAADRCRFRDGIAKAFMQACVQQYPIGRMPRRHSGLWQAPVECHGILQLQVMQKVKA